MKNIIIKEIKSNYYVVLADTERFGKQEIMFEGMSFDECTEWIKANTKPQKKALWAIKVEGMATKSVRWICVRSKDRVTASNRVWTMGYNNGYWFYGGEKIA